MNRLFLMTCAAALSLSASAVMAQTQATDEINSYLVPVTILDHPQCNGTGQTAFSLAMQAEDLRFRLSAGGWTTLLDTGGAIWFSADEVEGCFITEGRGLDRVQREVHCPEEARETAQAASLVTQTMQLDVSVNVTLCQSLMHYEVIDGQWTAGLTVGGAVTRHSGVFDTLTPNMVESVRSSV